MLEHGGQLRAAAAQYGIPVNEWLDLSTGINPVPYTPPMISGDAWARLPQNGDGLEDAAAAYYGTHDVLPVAGSQAAILALPQLRAPGRVGVLHPGYAEHAQAWRSAGHQVVPIQADDVERQFAGISVLVLMNPNNPTGKIFPQGKLREWHRQLSARGGWLVVDEAFIEATAETSLAQAEMPEGMIVLRSLGKFFGLAGARVGFVLAHAAVRSALRRRLGPWTLAGPSRLVAQAALRDRAWHATARLRLAEDGLRLGQLLRDSALPPSGGCGLFQWAKAERAPLLHQGLARCGILTRCFAEPSSLRFGLPGCDADWQRLRNALDQEHIR